MAASSLSDIEIGSEDFEFEEYKKKIASLRPWDRFSNWIYCICIVTFDIELGQAMEDSEAYHREMHDGEGRVRCESGSPCSSRDEQPTPKLKKVKSGIHLANDAIINLQRVIQDTSGSDEFQQFGNHIAAQLRQLPLRNAILLEDRIQSMLTQERINCMTPEVVIQSPMVYCSSPNTQATDQSPPRDILQEAMCSIEDDLT